MWCHASRRTLGASVVLLSTLFLSSTAQAVVYLISDFNNTITKEIEGGVWSNYYVLVRVRATAHSMVRLPFQSLPQRILVSHQDYENLRQDLAKSDGHTGRLEAMPLHDARLEDGTAVTELVPGYYYIHPEISYARHRGDTYYDPTISQPTNYLVEEDQRALLRHKNNEGEYLGYGFPLLKHFLDHPESTASVRILTFLGYPDQAFDELFKRWQRRKLIKNRPLVHPQGKPLAYWALFHPQHSNRFGDHYKRKKANWLYEFANSHRMRPPVESVLNPNGDDYEHYHTFIIQEDNPEVMENLLAAAQDLTRRGLHRIKFVFRHSGSQKDLEVNEFFIMNQRKRTWVRDVVVRSDGSLREAKPEELFVPLETFRAANSKLRSACERSMARSSL